MRPLWLAVLLVLVAAVSQVHSAELGLRRQKRGRKRGGGCGQWMLGECAPVEGECGPGSQQAVREGSCRVKEKKVDCAVPCADAPEPTIDIDGGPEPTAEQPPKQTRKERREGRRNKKAKGCRYRRESCGECDVTTNEKTCSMMLKKGEASCPDTKSVTRKCNKKHKKKEGCKYTKPKKSDSTWTKCDLVTNTKTITVTLKRGDPVNCPQSKVITRNCRSKRDKKRCRYRRGEWSTCDAATNTMSRTLTLRHKPADGCQPSKVITRKCKKECKYTKGSWTPCSETGTKSRVDSLLSGPKTCDASRTVERACKGKKNKCQYDFGSWSDCVDGQRTRTATLKPGGGADCTPTKTVSKSCQFKDGSGRCFYGAWGDFSACQNGVRAKIRPVLFGGERCERRAVKTKPC